MKFGVREICDVVLKAKTAQKVGKKVFYKNEPVLYFDTLKTSTLEGASSTVYAQGGRGNARLVAWEGERTVTFTMEDALISPEGFSILTGAGLVDGEETPVIMHVTEQTDRVVKSGDTVTITLSQEPYFGENNVDSNGHTKTSGLTMSNSEDYMYVMRMKDGNIDSEPYIPTETKLTANSDGTYTITIQGTEVETTAASDDGYPANTNEFELRKNDISVFSTGDIVFVDFYTRRTTGAYQVNITPDKFGGNYYLEASTLFRDTNGTDLPAEFIIPNCKIQSAFTFTMASSGDPSTFTFTMDAFPDYTRWNKTKKVFAAIQVFDVGAVGADLDRLGTPHNNANVSSRYDTSHKPFIEV